MSRSKRFSAVYAALVAMVAACTALSAVAASIPAVSFTSPGVDAETPLAATDGWVFLTDRTIQVTDLGVYDRGGDGLAARHPVAIWTSTGTLLTSTIVSPSDPLDPDWFRYAPISPIVLAPGKYVIGSHRSDSSDGIGVTATGFVTAPGIYHERGVYAFGPTLTLPTLPGGSNPAAFGPNFKFVPEPAGLGLLGAGLLVLRRRRRPGV